MTTIQKNLFEVIDTLRYLEKPPYFTSSSWVQLIWAVSKGEKLKLSSHGIFYSLLKREPTVCRKLLPYLEMTPRQGEILSGIHNDPERLALQREGTMLY